LAASEALGAKPAAVEAIDFMQRPSPAVALEAIDVLQSPLPGYLPVLQPEYTATILEDATVIHPRTNVGPQQSPLSSGVTSGAEAVAHLSKTQALADVAQAYGTSAQALAEVLYRDGDLKLSTSSQKLIYKCTGLAEAAAVQSTATSGSGDGPHQQHQHRRKLEEVAVEAADPLPSTLAATATGVPILHSRSSAKRKIYLDFDGHVTTGAAHNETLPLWHVKTTNTTLSESTYAAQTLSGFICDVSNDCLEFSVSKKTADSKKLSLISRDSPGTLSVQLTNPKC
jgi:hypothetical protein